MLGFHVTYKKSLKNILKKGLIPALGERSQQMEFSKTIYFFESMSAVEDALLNWLGDELDEDEEIVVLEVNLEGLPVKKEAFELQVSVPISPERILKVFTEQGEALFQKKIKSFNDLDILTGCVNTDTVEEDKGILWNKKAIADSNLKRNTIKQSMPISSPSTQTGNKRLKKQSCPTTDGCFQKKQKLESFTEKTTIYFSKIMQKCFLKNPKEVLPLTNLKGLNPKVHDLKLLQKYQEEIIHTYKTNPTNFNLDNIREISKESKNSITGFFRLKLLGANYLRLMVKGRYVKNSKNFYIEKVDSIRLRYQDTYEDFKKEIKKSKSGFPDDFVMDFRPPSGYWGWPWGNPDPYQGHHPMDYKVDDRNQLFGSTESPKFFFKRTGVNNWQHTYAGSDKSIFEIGKHRTGHAYTMLPHRIKYYCEKFGAPDFLHVLNFGDSLALKAIYAETGKDMIQLWSYVNIKQEPGWHEFERQANQAGYAIKHFHRGEVKDSHGYWLDKAIKSSESEGDDEIKTTTSNVSGRRLTTSLSPYENFTILNQHSFRKEIQSLSPNEKNLSTLWHSPPYLINKKLENINSSASISTLERIARWYMDNVFKDPEMPMPEFKIADQLTANWLGRCEMTYERKVPLIRIQKSILEDEKTLDRVIAHEMIHAWQYTRQPEFVEYFRLSKENPMRSRPEAMRIKRLIEGQGHGPAFFEWADKINQIKGPDYVNEKSDESYVIKKTGKQFYIFIEKWDDDFSVSTFVRPSPKIREEMKRRKESREAKLFKIDDQDLLMQKSLGEFGGARFRIKDAERKQKIQELWDKGTVVTASEYQDEGFVGEFWGSQASGILFKCNDKILLLERSSSVVDPGLWGIPGGAVPVDMDGNPKDIKQSALEEVAEEVGGIPPYQDTGKKTVFQKGSFKYTTFLFEVTKEFIPKLNWEHTDYKWVSVEDLPSKTHPGVKWSLPQLISEKSVESKLVLKDYSNYQKLVAEAYLARPDFEAEYTYSWNALLQHTETMFKQISTRLDIEFVPEDPYKNYLEMKKDIEKGVMKIYSGEATHPLWSVEQNLRFRAVHDYLIHFSGDFAFTAKGEIASYNKHAAIAPVTARLALFTEIVGQVCAYMETNKFQTQKITKLWGFDYTQVGKVDEEEYKKNFSSEKAEAEIVENKEDFSIFDKNPENKYNEYGENLWEQQDLCTRSSFQMPNAIGWKKKWVQSTTENWSTISKTFLVLIPKTHLLYEMEKFLAKEKLPLKIKEEFSKALDSENINLLEICEEIPNFDKKGERTFKVRLKFQEGFSEDSVRVGFRAFQYRIINPLASNPILLEELLLIDKRKAFYKNFDKITSDLYYPYDGNHPMDNPNNFNNFMDYKTPQDTWNPTLILPQDELLLATCFNFEFKDLKELAQNIYEWIQLTGLDPELPFYAAIQEDNRIDFSEVEIKQGELCIFVHYNSEGLLKDKMKGTFHGKDLAQYGGVIDLLLEIGISPVLDFQVPDDNYGFFPDMYHANPQIDPKALIKDDWAYKGHYGGDQVQGGVESLDKAQNLHYLQASRESGIITKKESLWTQKNTTNSYCNPKTKLAISDWQEKLITTALSDTFDTFSVCNLKTAKNEIYQYCQKNNLPQSLIQNLTNKLLESSVSKYLEQVGTIPNPDKNGKVTFRVRFKDFSGYSEEATNLRMEFEAYGYPAYSNFLTLTFLRIGPRKEFYKTESASASLKIYVDMDGVLCNFEKMFFHHTGLTTDEVDSKEMWEKIEEIPNFWIDMPWMPEGEKLWEEVKKYNPTILSSPALNPRCIPEKSAWVDIHLGESIPRIFETKKEKYAKPDAILIDDKPSNIEAWEKTGGIGILFTSTEDALKQLQEALTRTNKVEAGLSPVLYHLTGLNVSSILAEVVETSIGHYYHGTNSISAEKILKEGFDPNPQKKVWDESSSLESYYGTYFTNNLLTAISSGRRAVEKNGGEIAIFEVEIEKTEGFFDEDEFPTPLRSMDKSSGFLINDYYAKHYLKDPNEAVKEYVSKAAERYLQKDLPESLFYKEDFFSFTKEEKQKLFPLIVELIWAQVEQIAEFGRDSQKKIYAYRKALDQIIRALKGMPEFVERRNIRMLEGGIKITSLTYMPNYIKHSSEEPYVLKPMQGEPSSDFLNQFDSFIGGKRVLAFGKALFDNKRQIGYTEERGYLWENYQKKNPKSLDGWKNTNLGSMPKQKKITSTLSTMRMHKESILATKPTKVLSHIISKYLGWEKLKLPQLVLKENQEINSEIEKEIQEFNSAINNKEVSIYKHSKLSFETPLAINGYFRIRLLSKEPFLRLLVKGKYFKPLQQFVLDSVVSFRIKDTATYNDFVKDVENEKKTKSDIGWYAWTPEPAYPSGKNPMEDPEVNIYNPSMPMNPKGVQWPTGRQAMEWPSVREPINAQTIDNMQHQDYNEAEEAPWNPDLQVKTYTNSYSPTELRSNIVKEDLKKITTVFWGTLKIFSISNLDYAKAETHTYFQKNKLPQEKFKKLIQNLESGETTCIKQISGKTNPNSEGLVYFKVAYKETEGFKESPENFRIEFEASAYASNPDFLFLTFVRIDHRKEFYRPESSLIDNAHQLYCNVKSKEFLCPQKAQNTGLNPWKKKKTELPAKWALTSMSEPSRVFENCWISQKEIITSAQAPQWLTQPTQWNGKTPLKKAIYLSGKVYPVTGEFEEWILKFMNIPDEELKAAIENEGLTNSFFAQYRPILVDDLHFKTYDLTDPKPEAFQDMVLKVLLVRKPLPQAFEYELVRLGKKKKVMVVDFLKRGKLAIASNDWKSQGYKIHYFDTPQKAADFIESTPHDFIQLFPENLMNKSVYATKDGEIVGFIQFTTVGENLVAIDTRVKEEHRRKGLASAMYDEAELKSGLTARPSDNQTAEDKAFWKNRLAKSILSSAGGIPWQEVFEEYEKTDIGKPENFEKYEWEKDDIPIKDIAWGGIDFYQPLVTEGFSIPKESFNEDIYQTMTNKKHAEWSDKEKKFYETWSDEFQARRYAKLNTEPPPIVTIWENGKFKLWNGRHRVRAAILKGETTIKGFIGVNPPVETSLFD